MNSDEIPRVPLHGTSLPVRHLVDGLWRQREDLGQIADELLEILRGYGVPAPLSEERDES